MWGRWGEARGVVCKQAELAAMRERQLANALRVEERRELQAERELERQAKAQELERKREVHWSSTCQVLRS